MDLNRLYSLDSKQHFLRLFHHATLSLFRGFGGGGGGGGSSNSSSRCKQACNQGCYSPQVDATPSS